MVFFGNASTAPPTPGPQQVFTGVSQPGGHLSCWVQGIIGRDHSRIVLNTATCVGTAIGGVADATEEQIRQTDVAVAAHCMKHAPSDC